MAFDARILRAASAGACLLFAAPLIAQDSTTSARTSADSSFSDEQAERGGQVFVRSCVECHERLEMSNNDFRLKWSGQTTFDLFKSISTTMPDSDPGGLPRADYTAVVAYILKLNGVPAGVSELVEDSTAMRQHKLHLPPSTSDAGGAAREGRAVGAHAQLAHRAIARGGRVPHAPLARSR